MSNRTYRFAVANKNTSHGIWTPDDWRKHTCTYGSELDGDIWPGMNSMAVHVVPGTLKTGTVEVERPARDVAGRFTGKTETVLQSYRDVKVKGRDGAGRWAYRPMQSPVYGKKSQQARNHKQLSGERATDGKERALLARIEQTKQARNQRKAEGQKATRRHSHSRARRSTTRVWRSQAAQAALNK